MTIQLLEIFSMDIHNMALADWVGVTVTVITFFALTIAYIKVFHPKNKESLEAHRYHLIDHDREVPYWGREKKPTRIRHK